MEFSPNSAPAPLEPSTTSRTWNVKTRKIRPDGKESKEPSKSNELELVID